MPAGSSRAERLDPFTLPVRFAASDKAADERVRQVELSRERVVLRRAVRGIKMAVNLPVAAYLGVAIRMEPPEGDAPGGVAIVLEHRDPGFVASALSRGRRHRHRRRVAVVGARARHAAPGRRGRRPPCASRSRASARCASRRPVARRRRRSALKARRPSLPLRRRAGAMPATPIMHRGEREIIARN